MSSSNSNESAQATAFASVLKPGSSLHPSFLVIVDGAFVFLFLVLVVLAFLTSGNIHLFVLMGVELALWASVKWVVSELKSVTLSEQQSQEDRGGVKKDL